MVSCFDLFMLIGGNMKKTVIFTSIATLFVIVILFFIPITTLEVFVVDKGSMENEVILRVPAKVGDDFSVHWIHSVSKRPIIETYHIEEDYTISIKEMIFDTFSANLPTSPEYNTKWEFTDEYIRVYNYDVVFDSVPVVIGKVIADHQLVYGGEQYSLKDIYKPGGYVHIRAQQTNIMNYLTKGVTQYEPN